MSRRKVWVRRLLLAGLLVFAAEQLWRHGRDYVFADKFGVVEPGKVYRGAWQQPWPMRRIVRDYKIRSILALAHPPHFPIVGRERKLAEELGVRWYHVPIVDDRSIGDSVALFDHLEEAAALVADPANQPIYFHCHHGVNRASMVQIAYRTLYCGWTLDQAEQEVARTFGLVSVDHGPDYRYMKQFYYERVLPRRERTKATAAASTAFRQ